MRTYYYPFSWKQIRFPVLERCSVYNPCSVRFTTGLAQPRTGRSACTVPQDCNMFSLSLMSFRVAFIGCHLFPSCDRKPWWSSRLCSAHVSALSLMSLEITPQQFVVSTSRQNFIQIQRVQLYHFKVILYINSLPLHVAGLMVLSSFPAFHLCWPYHVLGGRESSDVNFCWLQKREREGEGEEVRERKIRRKGRNEKAGEKENER